METVKVLTVDLDTVEVKVKLDDIEAQLDRILDKQKQIADMNQEETLKAMADYIERINNRHEYYTISNR